MVSRREVLGTLAASPLAASLASLAFAGPSPKQEDQVNQVELPTLRTKLFNKDVYWLLSINSKGKFEVDGKSINSEALYGQVSSVGAGTQDECHISLRIVPTELMHEYVCQILFNGVENPVAPMQVWWEGDPRCFCYRRGILVKDEFCLITTRLPPWSKQYQPQFISLTGLDKTRLRS